jgi:hypothetical protein
MSIQFAPEIPDLVCVQLRQMRSLVAPQIAKFKGMPGVEVPSVVAVPWAARTIPGYKVFFENQLWGSDGQEPSMDNFLASDMAKNSLIVQRALRDGRKIKFVPGEDVGLVVTYLTIEGEEKFSSKPAKGFFALVVEQG